MRRQILRFPVGREFNKMLNDTHEWLVYVDSRLRPILTERGEQETIYQEMIVSAVKELAHRSEKTGKPFKIYMLHTHPGTNIPIPSEGDLQSYAVLSSMLPDPSKVIVLGYGIITKKGIFIIKINEKDLLKQIYNSMTIGDRYMGHTMQEYKKKVSQKSNLTNLKDIQKYSNTLSEEEQRQLSELSYKGGMKRVVEEEDGSMKTKTVRKGLPHFMRRRRR